jgi:hypothetical protein
MNFELLPNEILLDLFGYFNGVDLLRAFYDLNFRLNYLLYHQFRLYHFQFQCVSKRDFDLICQQHLPFIAEQVISIQLCDDTQTPEQIKLFFSYISSLNRFLNLRSMILYDFHSYEILLKLLDQCQQLCHLTHLNFYSCSFSKFSADPQLIVDKIWSLPKLISCQFGIEIEQQKIFCLPTIISSTLQDLSIFENELQSDQIYRLSDYTPRLKRLFAFVRDLNNNDSVIVSPILTLISLDICLMSTFEISNMMIFLQNMSNLRHLDISLWSGLINGYQWEQIIRNHLPQLKKFDLKMKLSFPKGEDIEEQVNILIDSFRSAFWIEEHQWFVRCFIANRTIYLYTLSKPYCYARMHPKLWQSTYPHDNLKEFYKNIISIYDDTFFDQPLPLDISLPNIHHLHIKCPINNQFWSVVPSLNQLKTLSISSHTDSFQSQVQILLDRAPHLIQLTIHQNEWLSLKISLFKYINTSIRELNLRRYDHYFNEEECLILSRSSLSIQCEVLFIWIENRQSIIYLIKNMTNLRVLIAKFKDDEYLKQSISTKHNDQFIQWIKDHLLSTYVIVRNSHDNSEIVIWM